MEIILRLMRLFGLDDRAAGLRAQFDVEARHANKHAENLQMGLPVTIIAAVSAFGSFYYLG